MSFETRWLGRLGYSDAMERMRAWVDERARGERADTLFTLEHPPVITLGRNARVSHLLATPERLGELGVEVHETTRGGDITFHGPGQLVGYGIVNLRERRIGPVTYMRVLEEACIRAARRYGVESGRRDGMTGVWTPRGKLVAMGVRFERGVTSHGFAFNVRTDLKFFDLIVPCGLAGEPVTSLELLTGSAPPLEELGQVVAAELERALDEAAGAAAGLDARAAEAEPGGGAGTLAGRESSAPEETLK
ncbi:MAG: lipoyl(octanoyl) transferase LipB [Candidatus Eisenbacteria bacterium]|nr:lipoyl(octanoyl) transferase LipB [Candidatus Eisenbacteria bacterium]